MAHLTTPAGTEAFIHRDLEERGAHASRAPLAAPWWASGRIAEWRLAPDRDPAAPLLGPAGDQALVGSGGDAEARGRLRPRLVELALAGVEQDTRHLGQEVGAVTGYRPQLWYRGVRLVLVGSRQGAWRLATPVRRAVSSRSE